MIEDLSEGIADTRMSITNILTELHENDCDLATLTGMQEWAVTAYKANKIVLMLSIDDEDIGWSDIEQLCIIKWRLKDIYDATDKLMQRIRYD